MKEYPKISIVTVNYNNGRYLEDTIQSVLGQGYPNLEYIIIDGGSTDNSLNIIKKYETSLAYWTSEKDDGQYYAVQKGFAKSTGQIMAWINSDDLYVPFSFYAVAEIFNSFPSIRWLMGIPREYDQQGVMMSRIALPWALWSKRRFYTYDYQFIQQESCFWRRDLWEQAGATLNTSYEYAADMELWARFFRYAKLQTTTATLAGFRFSDAFQRSKFFREEYLVECEKVIDSELNRLSVVKRVGYVFLRIAGILTSLFFFYEVPILNKLYRWLYAIPRALHYDFNKQKYVLNNVQVKRPPAFTGNRRLRKLFNRNKTTDLI